MKIEKKIQPKYFQSIIEGKKTFELRLNNFDCKQGDILVLKEWDPDKKEFTGRNVEKEITYIIKTKEIDFWSKSDIEEFGFQIISFR